jgi:hypothetical protein
MPYQFGLTSTSHANGLTHSYLLFAGSIDYPRGGMGDYVAPLNSVQLTDARHEALEILKTVTLDEWGDEQWHECSWYQIVNAHTLSVVEEGRGSNRDGQSHDGVLSPVHHLSPTPPSEQPTSPQ